MNRRYTFEIGRPATRKEWLRYVSLMALGGLVNYGAYVICIVSWDFIFKHPWLGVAVASIPSTAVNYISSRLMFLQSKKLKNTP